MDIDLFIEEAIAAGNRDGVESLTPPQRLVFLISEAESDCDMNGIDSFLDRRAPLWLTATAEAFDAIGATEIGAEFRIAPIGAEVGDPRLDRLNELIVARSGYDYDAIARAVAKRLESK